jgi:cytochrome c-type biogenesis protein CcsB
MIRYLVIFLLALVITLSGATGLAAGVSLNLKPWEMLAIQDNGRRKPVITFAREALQRLSGKASVEADGRTWAPSEFVLSMLLGTREWKDEPLILVGYRPLVQQLGLDATKKRFSVEELSQVPALERLAREAHELRRKGKDLTPLQKEVEMVASRLALYRNLHSGEVFLIVPPPGDSVTARWLIPPDATASYSEAQMGPAVEHLRGLASAYASGDPFQFGLHATQLRSAVRALNPVLYPSDSRLSLEYWFNKADPFRWAMVLYGFGWVSLWIGQARAKTPGSKSLVTAGLVAAFCGLAIHVAGITTRCIIAGRPPVTNMYESVVWVSFGVVAFATGFFARYRTPVYLLAALPVSGLCLLLLRQLPVAMPSNIDPLVPVLRSNFWLTIHVLAITLSYAAFALGTGFGHIVLFRYIRDPKGTVSDSVLHFWLYRVLQLGVLLLATGTILGGVWANYSWGRFWGWDPKETWALIALLCYIVVIHGRIAGWWDQFGLSVASVVCFCAVLMTWYGVNFVLGKGLHSYGFGIGGEGYVASAIIADLVFVAIAAGRYFKQPGVKAVVAEEILPVRE